MYGTIARMRVKPGMQDSLMQLSREYEEIAVPGYRGSVIYKTDNDPNEYLMAVVFDDADSYKANAENPDQHVRYKRMRELLESDPDWSDGEIVYQHMT